jgi:arylsulfatase A-like enzyme
VPGLTQSLDLMPTLLDAFGVALPPVHGHSLLPLAQGEADEVRAYACSGLEADGRAALALRSPEWTFLWRLRSPAEEELRPPQLHVRPDDRWEVNDVAQHHPELCEQLTEVLRGFVAATQGPGPLQPPKLPDPEAEVEATPSEEVSS